MGVGIVVPPGYTSPDVIDRREGQKPTWADRARDLIIKVRDDYNESLGAPKNDPPLDDEAVKRIHLKLSTMMGPSQ